MPPAPDISEWGFPNRATPFGSAVYYAVRFSPAAQRLRNARLIAWYALIQEIAQRPRDPGVARLKLDWWREELHRLAGDEPRHPLAIALNASGIGGGARPSMHAIVDAAEQAIVTPVPRDDDAFAAHCRQSLGEFFALLAAVEDAGRYAREQCVEAGAYCAAVEHVRRLRETPHRLPIDLAADTFAALGSDRRAARLEALLGRFGRPAALTGPGLPPLARRLLALAAATHTKMRRKGYPVADTPIDRAPIAHLWTAWRCR